MDLSRVLVIGAELSIDGSFFMSFNWIFLWEGDLRILCQKIR